LEISKPIKTLNESKIQHSKFIITRPFDPVLGNYEAEAKL